MRTGMIALSMLGRGSAVCHVRQSEHRHITSFARHYLEFRNERFIAADRDFFVCVADSFLANACCAALLNKCLRVIVLVITEQRIHEV